MGNCSIKVYFTCVVNGLTTRFTNFNFENFKFKENFCKFSEILGKNCGKLLNQSVPYVRGEQVNFIF